VCAGAIQSKYNGYMGRGSAADIFYIRKFSTTTMPKQAASSVRQKKQL